MSICAALSNMNLDLSSLGLEPGSSDSAYFCTPEGAQIIGWAGVDGIHFCLVEGYGETVFAVSPMNAPGDYVHPVAHSIEDFIRLMLACGGVAAVEQAWMWNRDGFDSFLESNPPNREQQAVLSSLSDALSLAPMADPYGYIHKLQSDFDCSTLTFSEEYYESDRGETMPPKSMEWRVSFGADFSGNSEDHRKPGTEVMINRTFNWVKREWHIPAVYSCEEGLVVDICVNSAPRAEYGENLGKDNKLLDSRENQIIESPMSIDVTPHVVVDDRELSLSSGSCFEWHTLEYDGKGHRTRNWEGMRLIEHYCLDPDSSWIFCRYSFPWEAEDMPALSTLSIRMELGRQTVRGPQFIVEGAGDRVEFQDPATGEHCILTVVDYDTEELSEGCLNNELEYPTHCVHMSYIVEPDISPEAMTVQDCGRGDDIRMKVGKNADEPTCSSGNPEEYSHVGIIGGADGPVAIVLACSKADCLHHAFSALRFKPAGCIDWRIMFHIKVTDDIEVALLP